VEDHVGFDELVDLAHRTGFDHAGRQSDHLGRAIGVDPLRSEPRGLWLDCRAQLDQGTELFVPLGWIVQPPGDYIGRERVPQAGILHHGAAVLAGLYEPVAGQGAHRLADDRARYVQLIGEFVHPQYRPAGPAPGDDLLTELLDHLALQQASRGAGRRLCCGHCVSNLIGYGLATISVKSFTAR